MTFPKDFTELVYLLDKEYHFTDILIVNTNGIPKTGEFLDTILEEKNPIRIKYTSNEYNKFVENINNLDKKFDLICLDPYHNYKESISDFRLLYSLLNDNGILISHDCYPPSYKYIPIHKPNGKINDLWCGATYGAFIEFSYDNPKLFYGIIKNDYGIGIISKKKIKFVKKLIINDKQKQFLNLFKNNKDEEAYKYFIINVKDIINLI